MITSNKTNSKQKRYREENQLETVRERDGVLQSLTSEVNKTTNALWEQLLGIGEAGEALSRGDLQQGQELNLKDLTRQKSVEKLDVDPAFDYRSEVLHGEKKTIRENSAELEVKIQEIVIELKRLASTSAVLEAEFKEVTVEQRISKPGKYHLSFFEWVLSVVKAARMRVEDSGAWLATFKSKKKQRQYWNMFKKHGTTFGLSNERVVATQTG